MASLCILSTTNATPDANHLKVSERLADALRNRPESVRYLTEEGEKRAFIYGNPMPLDAYCCVHEGEEDAALSILDASNIEGDATAFGMAKRTRAKGETETEADKVRCDFGDGNPMTGVDAMRFASRLLFCAHGSDGGAESEEGYVHPDRWRVWYARGDGTRGGVCDDTLVVESVGALFDSQGRPNPVGRQMMGEEPLDGAADVVVLDQPRWVRSLPFDEGAGLPIQR